MSNIVKLVNSSEDMETKALKENWEVDEDIMAELDASKLSAVEEGFQQIRSGMKLIADACSLDISEIIVE